MRRILFLLPIALASACDSKNPETPPLPDAAVVADAGEPDAGGMPDDAGSAEPPDAGFPPARVLVPMHLLGASPIENLVYSPHFDLSPSLWYRFTGNGASLPMQVLTHALTPGGIGLPILKLKAANMPQFLIGYVRGGDAPLSASVWLGRDKGATLSPNTFAIIGLAPSQATDRIFSFVEEEGSTVEVDRVEWTRFTLATGEPLLGVAAFMYRDSSSHNVYLTGLVAQQATTKALSPGSRPGGRPATSVESKAFHDALARLRSRPPPSRPAP